MRDFLLWHEKSNRILRRIANSSGSAFGNSLMHVKSFLLYANEGLTQNLMTYQSMLSEPNMGNPLNLESIVLEPYFPAQYRWMVKAADLKNSREFFNALEEQIEDFDSSPDTLEVVVGVHFLRYALTVKIVETLLLALTSEYIKSGKLHTDSIKHIGFDKTLLRFFDDLEPLCSKTLDEWKTTYTPSVATTNYFRTALKRMCLILFDTKSNS